MSVPFDIDSTPFGDLPNTCPLCLEQLRVLTFNLDAHLSTVGCDGDDHVTDPTELMTFYRHISAHNNIIWVKQSAKVITR